MVIGGFVFSGILVYSFFFGLTLFNPTTKCRMLLDTEVKPSVLDLEKAISEDQFRARMMGTIGRIEEIAESEEHYKGYELGKAQIRSILRDITKNMKVVAEHPIVDKETKASDKVTESFKKMKESVSAYIKATDESESVSILYYTNSVELSNLIDYALMYTNYLLAAPKDQVNEDLEELVYRQFGARVSCICFSTFNSSFSRFCC